MLVSLFVGILVARYLGPEHFDRLQPERLKRYYVSRLRNLGYLQ
jgi:hypothetical protein